MTCLKLFWEKICKEVEHFSISPPGLPRRHKAPRRFEEGDAESVFPETPDDYYRPIYFEALDLITTSITDRFNRPGYNFFHNVQNLILKAVQGLDYEAELKCVANFYTTDFNYELLKNSAGDTES